jgi:hypothetical protein
MKKPPEQITQITVTDVPGPVIDELERRMFRKIGKERVKVRSRSQVVIDLLLDAIEAARGGGGNRTRLESEGVAA